MSSAAAPESTGRSVPRRALDDVSASRRRTLDEHVRHIVDLAPPMWDEQRQRIVTNLRGPVTRADSGHPVSPLPARGA